MSIGLYSDAGGTGVITQQDGVAFMRLTYLSGRLYAFVSSGASDCEIYAAEIDGAGELTLGNLITTIVGLQFNEPAQQILEFDGKLWFNDATKVYQFNGLVVTTETPGFACNRLFVGDDVYVAGDPTFVVNVSYSLVIYKRDDGDWTQFSVTTTFEIGSFFAPTFIGSCVIDDVSYLFVATAASEQDGPLLRVYEIDAGAGTEVGTGNLQQPSGATVGNQSIVVVVSGVAHWISADGNENAVRLMAFIPDSGIVTVYDFEDDNPTLAALLYDMSLFNASGSTLIVAVQAGGAVSRVYTADLPFTVWTLAASRADTLAQTTQLFVPEI